jgi:Tol biopolymer transport system component
MTRLTFGEDTDSMDPIWTPDGERIIYASSRERAPMLVFAGDFEVPHIAGTTATADVF